MTPVHHAAPGREHVATAMPGYEGHGPGREHVATATPAAPRRGHRRATPGTRGLRLAALAALAVVALAACSGGATSAPSLPTIPPPTPTPQATPVASVPAGASASTGAVASPDLSGCPKSADQITPLKPGEKKTVTIETTAGTIVTEVSGDLAPIAAGNFVALAGCGYYDGVVFHRVVPDFVIQGGDGQYARMPIENPQHMGVGGPGYEFKDEPVVGDYLRGTLAMANAGPNTNGSQFFIVLKDLTGANALPKNYSIFGKVTQGMDVVDKIAAAPQSGPPGNVPNDPVVMTKVTVSQ